MGSESDVDFDTALDFLPPQKSSRLCRREKSDERKKFPFSHFQSVVEVKGKIFGVSFLPKLNCSYFEILRVSQREAIHARADTGSSSILAEGTENAIHRE